MQSFMILLGALTSSAFAGGTASLAPPPPPEVSFSALPPSASVQKKLPDGKNHPVQARLLLEDQVLVPGTTARVGLHLTQQPGWHTYWKSPGDIGLPTDINWTLPAEFSATAHTYPIPQRFEQEGQVSFGYNNEVLLIADLTVPATAKPGPIKLVADSNWLVCQTSCIPGDAHLELPATVGAKPTGKTPWAPLFDHYAKQHPVGAKGFTSELVLSSGALTPENPFKAAIVLTPEAGKKFEGVKPGWPTFTPIAASNDWWLLTTEVKHLDDGRVVAVMEGEASEPDPFPTNDAIGGLVQLKIDGAWVKAELKHPLTWAKTGTESSHEIWKKVAVAPAVEAPPPEGTPPPDVPEKALPPLPPPAPFSLLTLLTNMGMGLLGGLILNVMPCVLPVITLKLYGLIEQKEMAASQQRSAGMAYTGGILVSFWALAAVIIGMRVIFDIQVDWGNQFQYPPYVAGLAAIVFAFGLSLFGVFELPAVGAGAASEHTTKEGPVGYFFTGIFATLLATPCSAPFLGPAIAYAFAATDAVLIAIFTSIGFGLALPFLVIAFAPALYRFLPQPGAWMETFKQFMGFTLVGTTIWLVSVLLVQIGSDRTIGFLIFLMFVSIGAWVFGRFGGVAESGRRQLLAAGAGAIVVVAGGVGFLDLEVAAAETCDTGELASDLDYSSHMPWQPFSEERLAKLDGTPVFIDFTADWCVSCKVNEKTVLETATVRDEMAKLGVVPLKADWTRRDPVITEWLHRYQRAAVPMYLVVPGNGSDPILLPEVITPGMVVDAVRTASK